MGREKEKENNRAKKLKNEPRGACLTMHPRSPGPSDLDQRACSVLLQDQSGPFDQTNDPDQPSVDHSFWAHLTQSVFFVLLFTPPFIICTPCLLFSCIYSFIIFAFHFISIYY